MKKSALLGKTVLFLTILLGLPLAALAQDVKGTVTDASTGEPLIGVTVKS